MHVVPGRQLGIPSITLTLTLTHAHPPPTPTPLSQVITLKTDNRYWPCWELRLNKRTSQWTRRQITARTK